METVILGNHIVVDIHKPMSVQPDYDFCRVNKAYFDKAKKTSRYVLVRTPNGERVFMPKAMKKYKVVKECFLFKNSPMLMYQLIIPHCEKKENDYYRYTDV
jgi:hypothetical protein